MKNNRVLVTVSLGKIYNELISPLTHPTLEDYAYRMGADFFVIEDRKLDETYQEFWEKLRMRDLLDQYDRVLFMDSDIIVHPRAPSLFDLVPLDCLGMTNEGYLQSISDKEHELKDFCKQAGIKMSFRSTRFPDWDGRYWNVGVILFGQEHRSIFSDPPVFITHKYPEQAWVNIQIARLRPKMFCLPRAFHDWKFLMKEDAVLNQLTGSLRWIIHYAGQAKNAALCNEIKEDLDKWSRT